MEQVKSVAINGVEYRVGRLKAQDGGWVTVMLTSKMREQAEREQAAATSKRKAKTKEEESAPPLSYEDGMMMTAAFLIAQLGRAELAEVQAMCLARCFQRQEQAGTLVDMPVYQDGRWLVTELEYDAPTVLELTKHSLAFNIAPFFPAPASS